MNRAKMNKMLQSTFVMPWMMRKPITVAIRIEYYAE